MAGGYIGNAAGTRREIVDAYVGTPAGRKQIAAAWVGTGAGNKQWYARTPDLWLAGAAGSSTTIALHWNSIGPTDKFTYHVYRNGVGLVAITGLAFNDSGLAPSTTYNYTLYAVRNGIVADEVSLALRTQAAPPPPPPSDVPFDTGQIACYTSATYGDSGATVRWDAKGQAHKIYCGRYDGTWNNQKSTWNFHVPAHVRGCKSLEVYMRVRIDHTYSSAGSWWGVVLHHNNSQASGSTGTFGYFRARAHDPSGMPDQWLAHEPVAGQGENANAEGWIRISDYQVPGSFNNRNWSVRDEFRYGGATGLGFFAPQATTSYYGYGWGWNSVANSFWWPSIRFVGIL